MSSMDEYVKSIVQEQIKLAFVSHHAAYHKPGLKTDRVSSKIRFWSRTERMQLDSDFTSFLHRYAKDSNRSVEDVKDRIYRRFYT